MNRSDPYKLQVTSFPSSDFGLQLDEEVISCEVNSISVRLLGIKKDGYCKLFIKESRLVLLKVILT